MGERRYTVTASQAINLQTFYARQAMISNLLPSWLFVRIGGTDIPNQRNADWSVPPLTAQIIPLPATNMVAVGVGPALVTVGQQVMAGQGAIITLYDIPTPVAVGSIDLNPSRMGQMVQQSFVAPASYTLAFPATTVHVANYSTSWLYVGIGTLVAPTVATCSIAIPPMTEKALPCVPTLQFAFSFSAALVTVGDQVPAGMRVIVTFYEYPTPVAIGTADLQPSKMGQSIQQIFVANSAFTIGFRATMIHVSNYSASYVYVAYGTLIFPNAANAMASVPPFSERNLPCPPNVDFAFGLSAATVVVATGVPQTNIVATFYEYPVPLSLGTAQLSPGGFRYQETINNNHAVPALGEVVTRNLSNFNLGRYMFYFNAVPGGNRYITVEIIDATLASSIHMYQLRQANVTHAIVFPAGISVSITRTPHPAVAGWNVTERLEAWNG